jgi:hypothetical protein
MSEFYERLSQSRSDSTDLQECITKVVTQLESLPTEDESPGMLLGKIQSGKTRAFVGSIALAFDRGFDMAIVFTKGTKTLSAQTMARLESDFREFLEDDDFIVLDIMQLPGRLTGSELARKIIVVAKKETRNLDKLRDLFDDYPILKNKRVLLIDDEADLASIRFTTSSAGDIEQGKISEKIDALRHRTENMSFLEVTATPYSLYLQPEKYETGSQNQDYVFKPKKPAFTELLPIHAGYVGGDDYFGPFDETDPRHFLYVEVPLNELDVLRQADRRRVREDNVLTTDNITGLRRSVVTFVVAVCIRRIQQREAGKPRKKYAMVIHVDTRRAAHAWQDMILDWIFERIRKRAKAHSNEIRPIFSEAYEDIARSAKLQGLNVPDADEVFVDFLKAFLDDDVVRERVNTDNDVLALLDQNAELKLRTPYNIFIGGSILDRGVTIPNLISFYYGRNPRTMQADTVLQHSRMYGSRDRDDLAVTRFYTSRGVYDRLYDINEFENSLREAFESGAHDKGVVFIQSDPTGRIRPCAPNKILLSDVVSLRPGGMLLPTSFQVAVPKTLARADGEIRSLLPRNAIDSDKFHAITKSAAKRIIEALGTTMKFDASPFEWDAMTSLLDYYGERVDEDDAVLLWVATGRQLSRQGSGDKSGRSIVGTALRRTIEGLQSKKPILVLLQVNGSVGDGWTGSPFWWPILVAPADVEPCVFASKTED